MTEPLLASESEGVQSPAQPRAWRTALYVFAIWVLITGVGGLLTTHGRMEELAALIRAQLAWGVAGAAIFVTVAIAYLGWWNEVGLTWPRDTRVLAFPAITLLVFLGITIAEGQIAQPGTGFVVVNTLLVGVSEELMFRGVLLHGAIESFGTSRAVFVTAAVFGGVHTLNALITGSLGAAVAQAVIASLFGVWACAVRLRTGSVVPMIGFHWMWDCLLVLGGVGVGLAALVAAPLLFLWGLRLLRGVEEPRVGPPGAAPPEAIGDRPHVSPGETPASQSGASRV